MKINAVTVGMPESAAVFADKAGKMAGYDMPRVANVRAGLLALTLFAAAPAFAAHPLTTEDTGTQGRNHVQLEVTAEYGKDKAAGVEEKATDVAAVFAYGLRDDLDLLLTLPYARVETRENGATTTVDGLGDVGLDAKWRFFEAEHLSLALKTGVSFASGDDTRGLGAGKSGFGISLVASYEMAEWGYHVQLGHLRNRNVHDEREAIQHVSVAVTRMVTDKLMLAAELGSSSTTDRAVDEDARFMTLGAVYGVRDDFDIDIGLKRGLSDPETDTTLQVGMALRF